MVCVNRFLDSNNVVLYKYGNKKIILHHLFLKITEIMIYKGTGKNYNQVKGF